MSIRPKPEQVKTPAPSPSRRRKARRALSTGYCNPPTPARLVAPWGATAVCVDLAEYPGNDHLRTTVVLRAPRRMPVVEWLPKETK